MNNAARHSGCARANINLSVESGWLVLKVSDDGNGFNPTEAVEGQGLAGMTRRAESFDGMLEIISKPGDGTTVGLRVPLRPSKLRLYTSLGRLLGDRRSR